MGRLYEGRLFMPPGEIREMKKKICLVGDSKVGKTSLLKRYIDNEFDNKYIASISAKIFNKDLQVKIQNNGATNVVNMNLSIWDLIGHRDHEYWALMKRYYLNTDGALFVCDLTSEKSLENLKDWVSSLFNTIGVIPFIVMANKSDLGTEAKFDEEALINFTKQYHSDFYYTSAKDGTNVELSFQHLSKLMAQHTFRIENIKEPKDVLQEIIIDYCTLHGGEERVMPIINHQFKLAGASMSSPTKQSLTQVIDRLIQITKDIKGEEIAREERSKYLRLIHKLP